MHLMVQRKHICNLRSTELPSQFKERKMCECGPVNRPLAGSGGKQDPWLESRIPVLQLPMADECIGSRLSQLMLERTLLPAKQRLGPPPLPQQRRPLQGFSVS